MYANIHIKTIHPTFNHSMIHDLIRRHDTTLRPHRLSQPSHPLNIILRVPRGVRTGVEKARVRRLLRFEASLFHVVKHLESHLDVSHLRAGGDEEIVNVDELRVRVLEAALCEGRLHRVDGLFDLHLVDEEFHSPRQFEHGPFVFTGREEFGVVAFGVVVVNVVDKAELNGVGEEFFFEGGADIVFDGDGA